MRAWLNLRYAMTSRRAAFEKGLARLGYKIDHGVPHGDFGPNDIFVTWNRIGLGDREAKRFEKRCQPVIVAENAAWGNEFLGGKWHTLARNRHNTAGCFDVGGPERWDALGFVLEPFRTTGETVILPQRGIGSPPTSMPTGWPKKALAKYGGRVRAHPGRMRSKPLEQDLANCGRVITWGSGAAVKALMMGIPVISEMPKWIAKQDNTEAGRLDMFRRIAWAQWELDEIATGEPFARLLCK